MILYFSVTNIPQNNICLILLASTDVLLVLSEDDTETSLQCWSEIIETNAKNGVVFDATSNEQPIKMTNPVGFKTSLLYL